jgi:hypothetical protein
MLHPAEAVSQVTINSLLRLVPPPSNPREAEGSWERVEEVLGVELPDDYKRLIEAYGTGTFSEFIWVLNPFSSNPNLNLIEQSTRQLGALRELREQFGEWSPFDLHPTPGGLLPVAITDNGDVVHWLTDGKADEWTIVVNEGRSPEYEQFDCGIAGFLERLAAGSLTSEIFPDLSPAAVRQFRPI